jgi:hypothetical protein
MKVRMENNKLVLRINESEMNALLEERTLHVSIDFPQEDLHFSLRLKEDINCLEVEDARNEIAVFMPTNYMDRWEEKMVGFEEIISLANNKSLTIIIEKDLKRSKKRNKLD